MNHHGIAVPKERMAEFCRRNHIRRLAFFGSVLRDDFQPGSDLDVLVEFEPGHTAGLLRMAGLELELSAMFGRKVDLRTPGELSRYFRDEVVRTSEVQYAQE
jgi:predicted nucleotidyltransferase